MVEFLEPSQPNQEENDKEEERPDDLDEKAAPVPFPQGQVLPEKELKLEEESHLVAISVSPPHPSRSRSPSPSLVAISVLPPTRSHPVQPSPSFCLLLFITGASERQMQRFDKMLTSVTYMAFILWRFWVKTFDSGTERQSLDIILKMLSVIYDMIPAVRRLIAEVLPLKAHWWLVVGIKWKVCYKTRGMDWLGPPLGHLQLPRHLCREYWIF